MIATVEFRLPGPYSEYSIGGSESFESSRDQMIASVIPLVTKKVREFLAKLSPRDRSAYDLDDLVQECWLALSQKHHHYEPSRARYTTFAVMVVSQHLSEIRSKAKLIAAPRDAYSRVSGQEETSSSAMAVARSLKDVASIEDYDCADDRGAAYDEVERNSLASVAASVIAKAIRSVTDEDEMAVLCLSYGLCGAKAKSMEEIAVGLGITVAQTIQLKKRAEKQVFEILSQEGVSFSF